MRQFHRKDPM